MDGHVSRQRARPRPSCPDERVQIDMRVCPFCTHRACPPLDCASNAGASALVVIVHGSYPAAAAAGSTHRDFWGGAAMRVSRQFPVQSSPLQSSPLQSSSLSGRRPAALPFNCCGTTYASTHARTHARTHGFLHRRRPCRRGKEYIRLQSHVRGQPAHAGPGSIHGYGYGWLAGWPLDEVSRFCCCCLMLDRWWTATSPIRSVWDKQHHASGCAPMCCPDPASDSGKRRSPFF
ncbi:hypothetical protein JOL62DRAFT_581774 [Phyllosticta paracitricarpa]|uniref:C2H2-type domain-containing protein n=2 Tax=Phyllosticta TaxID=121621 RepID=A0ABR1LSW9_9PEZI